MRVTKWIFFGYLTVVALLVAGIALSFAFTPARNPDTLYTALPANIKTLDPALANDTIGSGVIGEIYECLYNYKYGVRPYELFPELAADAPRVDSTGKIVTIALRKGIHFCDPDRVVFADGVGPEVTADDVIYSWKRVADFHLASPLYAQVFQDRIVGLDDWWAYTQKTSADRIDWDRPISGLKALDPHTLQITLTEPFPQLKYNLAYGPTAVVCRAAVEKYGEQFSRHPVGTGPYALKHKNYLAEQRLILTANPIYRGRPDVDGYAKLPASERLPRIPRLQLDYFQESLPVWILFQQGLFDIGGIPKDSFHQAVAPTGSLTAEMVDKGIRLDKSPEPATYYIGFNMQDPVVGHNKPLRQAMSMALDRKALIDAFLNGRGEPAIGPIPPGFPTFDRNAVNPYTQFNLAAARRKLQEAVKINHGPIPTLQLLMGDTSTDTRQEAEFFARQMSQIGINVVVEYRTWARFQEMIDHRQAQLFSLGWVADYPDEQDFFQLFYGPNGGPNGSNPTGFANAEFDALYKKTSVMDRSPERDRDYRRMNQIVQEECPWLLEFYPVAYSLYYDWVGNFHPTDYGYGHRQYLELDSGLRRGQRHGH